MFPFFQADPGVEDTQPYHIYFRRHEPEIVFGGVSTGVPNPADDDGRTLLDVVWAGAPFPSHARFVAGVERASAEWVDAGRLTADQRTVVVDAARQAESELAV